VQPQSLKDRKKIAEVKRNVPALTFTRRNSTNITKMKDVKDIKEDNNKKLLKSIKTSSLSNKNINGEGKNERQTKSEEVAGNKRVSKVALDSDDNREKGHVAQTLMKKEDDELEIVNHKTEDEQEEKVVR
jgi:hypothetical protein